jgi:hypothetical protein
MARKFITALVIAVSTVIWFAIIMSVYGYMADRLAAR